MAHAKLMRQMDLHAAEFNQAMRGRLVETLLEPGDDVKRALQFAERLPLENQKILGYFVWSVANLNKDLAAGKVAQAELRSLRILAGIDQYLLDGHWRSGWALTGLGEPPWPTWEKSSLKVHKRTFSASPLLPDEWVSMAIAKAKGDAFLRGQRQQPIPPAEDPAAGGCRGRGRHE